MVVLHNSQIIHNPRKRVNYESRLKDSQEREKKDTSYVYTIDSTDSSTLVVPTLCFKIGYEDLGTR